MGEVKQFECYEVIACTPHDQMNLTNLPLFSLTIIFHDSENKEYIKQVDQVSLAYMLYFISK